MGMASCYNLESYLYVIQTTMQTISGVHICTCKFPQTCNNQIIGVNYGLVVLTQGTVEGGSQVQECILSRQGNHPLLWSRIPIQPSNLIWVKPPPRYTESLKKGDLLFIGVLPKTWVIQTKDTTPKQIKGCEVDLCNKMETI